MSDDSGGTVYLLHLDPPLKHARHYTGWTSNLGQRLDAHRAGRGARLMEVVKEAGGSFTLARTWPGSRNRERAIKDMKAAPKAPADLVPDPGPEPVLLTAWPGRAAAPGASDDLLEVTGRLITGWRAQAADPEPELEAGI